MLSLVGLRVVRGPDWKWEDQDGGEGNVGTVISSTPSTEFMPGKVFVAWDSGLTGKYRGGPEGQHDLRILNNDATGMKHSGYSCDGEECQSREIRGIRWKCDGCNINLCTSCFLKEEPHNRDHNQFTRFTGQGIETRSMVSCWGENGPDSRMKVTGICPGAKVCLVSNFQNAKKEIGVVIPGKQDDTSNDVVVKWLKTMQVIRYQRFQQGKSTLCALELSIGGNYYPAAFQPLTVPMLPLPQTLLQHSAFCVGDRVQIRPELGLGDFKKKLEGLGVYKDSGLEKITGVIGTVYWNVNQSNIAVRFQDDSGVTRASTWADSSIFLKLNKFSVHQVVRIRNDEKTVEQIAKQFASFRTNEDNIKLEGALGRVTGVDERDPEKLYIQFDNDNIYKWLYKGNPLPSNWMEPFGTAQPSLDNELIGLAAKQKALFFEAVKRGDLRTAMILHTRHGVDVDALDETTMNTALQLACSEGYKDLVVWLLDGAQVELEKTGWCNPEIMEILIERGTQLDSQNNDGNAALHVAAFNQYTECIRVLIHHGCDVNIQNNRGNTPLHDSILFGKTLKVIQILSSCGRINWKMRNKNGLNVLHLAADKGDLKVIELTLLTNADKNFLMELTGNGITVLHLACVRQNFQVAKLLLDHVKQRNQLSPAIDAMTTISEEEPKYQNQFERFLEAKSSTGATALICACFAKNYAIVDLLIEAGADVTAIDSLGQTALMFVAWSSLAENAAPSKEWAPSIFKFYQNMKNHSIQKMMKQHPILFLILYLIEKGCCWEASNVHNKTATDILMQKGYQKEVIDVLDQFAAEKRKSSVCMGQQNECKHPPNFTLSCPQKGIYSACINCFFSTVEKVKYGCSGETIVPIENPSTIQVENDSDNQSSITDGNSEEKAEDYSGYGFKFIKDGSEFGFVEDQFGNQYNWCEHIRGLVETVTKYRCEAVEKGCPAVVRRIVSGESENVEFKLDSAHTHPVGERKRKSYSTFDTSEESAAKSVSKRGKMT